MTPMNFSIIIPTYNRADSLAQTLDSLAGVNLPAGCSAEVLVIDNNSRDQTARVVAERAGRMPYALRHVLETRQGSNFARNRGIAEASGSHLIFTDDDVALDPAWLCDYAEAFARHPGAACLTGRVIPRFLAARPAWLTDNLLCYYGEQDFGDAAAPVLYPKYPVEMNIAFARETLEHFGGFSTAINRDAKTLMSNDGMIFFERLARAGATVLYLPGALIYHLIPGERIDQRWILRRVYWQGRSDVGVGQMLAPPSKLKLVGEALAAAWRAFQGMRGGHLLPRRAYWHYRGQAVDLKCEQWYELGLARQKFHSVFGF